jgi:hypothetical protein
MPSIKHDLSAVLIWLADGVAPDRRTLGRDEIAQVMSGLRAMRTFRTPRP